MRRFFFRLSMAAVAASALFTASCGGGRGFRLPETGATLEGTVTYNGQPIEFALILIQTDKGSANGKIGDDKRYLVENVPLGEVMIGVNTSAARGEFQSKVMSESQGKPKGTRKFVDVPEKYFDPEKSGFKTTITKGTNTFDIVIPK